MKNKGPLDSERIWAAIMIIDNGFYIIVSCIVNEHEPLSEVALGITVTTNVPLSRVWVVWRETQRFLETELIELIMTVHYY